MAYDDALEAYTKDESEISKLTAQLAAKTEECERLSAEIKYLKSPARIVDICIAAIKGIPDDAALATPASEAPQQ